jgi:hypothetical protein
MKGSIIVGPNRQYNCRLKDGTIVCPDCKLEEIIGEVVQWPKLDTQSTNA